MLIEGFEPKTLVLTIGAAAGLVQLRLSTADAEVPLIVFVLLGSLTVAGPVVYYLRGDGDDEACEGAAAGFT